MKRPFFRSEIPPMMQWENPSWYPTPHPKKKTYRVGYMHYSTPIILPVWLVKYPSKDFLWPSGAKSLLEAQRRQPTFSARPLRSHSCAGCRSQPRLKGAGSTCFVGNKLAIEQCDLSRRENRQQKNAIVE